MQVVDDRLGSAPKDALQRVSRAGECGVNVGAECHVASAPGSRLLYALALSDVSKDRIATDLLPTADDRRSENGNFQPRAVPAVAHSLNVRDLTSRNIGPQGCGLGQPFVGHDEIRYS